MSDYKDTVHQIRFRLGLCPRPRWGSLHRCPRRPSWYKGPTVKGGEGRERGKGEKEETKGMEGKGGNAPLRKFTQKTAPRSKVLLRYCLSFGQNLSHSKFRPIMAAGCGSTNLLG